MNIIERAISSVAGGRVLDVATQEGHFVQMLMKSLQSYTEIVGIDVNKQAIETARDTIGQEKIQFLVMNAEQLDFEDESFDTVSISASFHTYDPNIIIKLLRLILRITITFQPADKSAKEVTL